MAVDLLGRRGVEGCRAVDLVRKDRGAVDVNGAVDLQPGGSAS